VGLAAAAPSYFLLFLCETRLIRPAEDLQNAAEPPGELSFEHIEGQPEQAQTDSRRYKPLSSAAMATLVVCLVLGYRGAETEVRNASATT